jgi:hypothetical protein
MGNWQELEQWDFKMVMGGLALFGKAAPMRILSLAAESGTVVGEVGVLKPVTAKRRMPPFMLHNGDANHSVGQNTEADDIGKPVHERAPGVAPRDHSAFRHGGDFAHLSIKGVHEILAQPDAPRFIEITNLP